MRRARVRKWLNARMKHGRHDAPVSHVDPMLDDRHSAIVIGYGPVGRTLCRLLRDNEIDPTVIEMNADTIKTIRRAGMTAVLGDATHRDTLQAAHIAKAESLILTASALRGSEEVIRLARELNPKIRVLARTGYLREGPPLRQAGADRVVAGEGEVALAMTEHVLRALGASPEQVDRERQRVRDELFGELDSAPTVDNGSLRPPESDEPVS